MNKCEDLKCPRYTGKECPDCDNDLECPECCASMEWQEFDKCWICDECGNNE